MSKHATPAAEHGATKSGSMAGKLKIGGIILAVVLLEWVAAYFLLGSKPAPASDGADAAAEAPPDEPAPAHAEEHASSSHGAAKSSGHGGGHGKEKEGGKENNVHHGDQEEVDLGEFTVTAYQPVSNSTLFISFHLYGTCMHKHAEEFNQRLADTKFRIRDNVIVIIRSAEISDLTDAGLGLIKRRILETTNKALGKSLLQSVMFSEFSFVEQ
jgi:flagellar FliL protein